MNQDTCQYGTCWSSPKTLDVSPFLFKQWHPWQHIVGRSLASHWQPPSPHVLAKLVHLVTLGCDGRCPGECICDCHLCMYCRIVGVHTGPLRHGSTVVHVCVAFISYTDGSFETMGDYMWHTYRLCMLCVTLGGYDVSLAVQWTFQTVEYGFSPSDYFSMNWVKFVKVLFVVFDLILRSISCIWLCPVRHIPVLCEPWGPSGRK